MTPNPMFSLAQISLETSNLEHNLIKTEDFVKRAKAQNSNIIIFPEMWLTGFNVHVLNKYKSAFDSIKDAVALLAKKYAISICGSLPALNEHQHITNACMFFNPQGVLEALYRKVHLFSPTLEERAMSPGSHLTILDHAWGKLGFAICYDLRFPELFRSYALLGVKIMLLVAAFPHPRLEHWSTLVRARAIENQMYIVCVNRVGQEVFQHGTQLFFGHSMIVNPWGELLVLGSEQETLLTASIDLNLVDTIRNDIPVFKDRQPHVYHL